MSKLLDAARLAADNLHNIAFRKAGVLAHVLVDLRDAIAEEEARISLTTIGRPISEPGQESLQSVVDDHREAIKTHWPKAGLTDDPSDPRLGRGVDDTPRPQNEVYLVLSEEERAKGFVRPYRDAYRHKTCEGVTKMGRGLSETYAVNPKFYGSTYCTTCRMHKPVSEFVWTGDGEEVGS